MINKKILDEKLLKLVFFPNFSMYKKSNVFILFLFSLIRYIRYSLKSIFTVFVQEPNLKKINTVAFYRSFNELNSLNKNINLLGRHRKLICISPKGKNLNWFKIVWKIKIPVITVFRRAYKIYGYSIFKDVYTPIMALKLYIYFENIIYKNPTLITIVTCNTTEPFALALHSLAAHNFKKSVYLEHAMTSKSSVSGAIYDTMYLLSPHTKSMFIELGVLKNKIKVINSYEISSFSQLSIEDKIRTIGVGVTESDDVYLIRQLISYLSKKGYKIIVRFHESFKSEYKFTFLKILPNVKFERSPIPNVKVFFKNIDILIAGNTTLILDSAINKVPAIYVYNSRNLDPHDYYGIVNYLNCPEINEPKEFEIKKAYYYGY